MDLSRIAADWDRISREVARLPELPMDIDNLLASVDQECYRARDYRRRLEAERGQEAQRRAEENAKTAAVEDSTGDSQKPDPSNDCGNERRPLFQTASGSVRLFDPRVRPIVRGKRKGLLTAVQRKILVALIKANNAHHADETRPRGLKLSQLERMSAGFRDVLRKLCEDDDWRACIGFPSNYGDGYHIE